MYRYKIYKSDSKVVAVGSFAGKPVKGIAKCDPEDAFSAEIGEKLAVTRCENKINAKRMKSAEIKLKEAIDALAAAQEKLDFMYSYHKEATDKFNCSQRELEELLNSLK
jgi:hypothetical protein